MPTVPSVKLKKLPNNGVIGITAPASPPDPQKLERGIRYLESLGYRIEVGETCYETLHYLAGDDALRAHELNSFFERDDIDAVFCARGGFGSMRLLNMLDFELIRASRKLFVGFSDITALQWALIAKVGFPSISAGMAATDMSNVPRNEQFESHFWDLVHSGKMHYSFDADTTSTETIRGMSLPGTISVAAKLLGSSYFPNTHHSILVLEDVFEMRHKMEGYLQQFALCGHFDKASAIILGEFTPAPAEEYPIIPEMETVFSRVFKGVKSPLAKGMPYGHIPGKISVPSGVELSVSFGLKTTLTSLQSLYEE